MPITLTLDKTSYTPGAEVYVTVEASVEAPVQPVEYVVTASRTVDGVPETAEVSFVVNYPRVVTPVAVESAHIPLGQQPWNPAVWGGRVPSEPPAA